MLPQTDCPSTTDESLHHLLREYARHGKPVEVSFRRLVPWIPYNTDRLTHLVHHYPAKLIPQIPHFFVNNELLSSRGDTVLDPFCGTGTVALEAIAAGRDAIGADSNPLAHLITIAKCTTQNSDALEGLPERIRSGIAGAQHYTIPPVVNLEYWFSDRVVQELGLILTAISEIQSFPLRNLAQVTFSHTLRDVSLADPRVSVPVRLNPDRFPVGHCLHTLSRRRLTRLKRMPVADQFFSNLESNIRRVKSLERVERRGRLRGLSTDARRLHLPQGRMATKSVQLAITSPPYLGAQKYVRASSLNLGWLNLVDPSELASVASTSIGREHLPKSACDKLQTTGLDSADRMLRKVFREYPLRAQIAATYLLEMRQSIVETFRVLKHNGYFVLVAGTNRLCGRDFNTPAYLRQIAEEVGFRTKLVLVDTIHSRGLMTKRNRTAGVIPHEWVFIFEKNEFSR